MPHHLNNLGAITPRRKNGSEAFTESGQSLGFDVLDFWQWSCSDLLSNATRGILAEYLVGQALGAVDGVREEWGAFDLITPAGVKVEVKSSSYLQSWHQKRLSAVVFGVPKTRKWDAVTGTETKEAFREADVYVFALLAHQDKNTVDPLDLSQWQFYVVPTFVLDERQRSQHSITLPSLIKIGCIPLAHTQLRAAVNKAARKNEERKAEQIRCT